METLGADDAQTGVGVAEYKHCIGLGLHHQPVGGSDDVAHCIAEVFAYGIHVYFGIGKLQVSEEDAVEVVVVVLTGMGENHVKIFTATVDDCREAYDFGTCADNDQ